MGRSGKTNPRDPKQTETLRKKIGDIRAERAYFAEWLMPLLSEEAFKSSFDR